MKIALDPYMFRTTPLVELPALIAELGYEHIELSPRDDFLPFFLHPRNDKSTATAFKAALHAAGVSVSSVLPQYRRSGPDASCEATYTEAVAGGTYVSLGQTDVDIHATVAALEGSGYAGWYVLEQDTILSRAPVDGGEGPDPVADVRASIGYLLAVAAQPGAAED